MASKRWTKSYCWEKLRKLDVARALRGLRYSHKATLNGFLRDLRLLETETRITGERLQQFVREHKPIINLILCGGLPFDSDDEAMGKTCGNVHIRSKDSVFLSLGFHVQLCECFLLSVMGQPRAWKSSLREISLDGASYSLSQDEVVALCANLSSNLNVRSLDLRNQKIFHSREGCRLLGQALRTNSTLEKLFISSADLTSEGVEQLTNGLQGDSISILEVLDLGLNPKIADSGIRHLAKLLVSNKTLKCLQLKLTGSGFEGAKLMASALLLNSTLEFFSFGGNKITEVGMTLMLSPLTPVPTNSATGRSISGIKHLELEDMDRLDFSVGALAMMITRNKKLESLNISRAPIEEEEWMDQIIPALYQNRTLKCLDLRGSNNLPSEGFFDLVTSASSKTVLEHIDLAGTNIFSRSEVLNDELKLNGEMRRGSKAKRRVKLKSGRFILCGYSFAGKSTICRSMRYVVDGPPAFYLCSVAWRKFLRKSPLMRKALFGTSTPSGDVDNTTRGCDVVTLRSAMRRSTDIVWDFAGHKEYDALHNYLFSNFSNSCFLCIASAFGDMRARAQTSQRPGSESRRLKEQRDIKEELEYWMRLIASSSRPSPRSSQRPVVMFVLTNGDELDPRILRDVSQRTESVVAEMRERYQSVVDLQQGVKVIDSHSCKDVQELMTAAQETLAKVLQNSAEFAVCEEVRLVLENWSAKSASKPILRMEDFQTLCERELRGRLNPSVFASADLHTARGQIAVLKKLNDNGDIMFSSSLDVIVVNPKWFGGVVLGSVLHSLRGVQQRPGRNEGIVGFFRDCLHPAGPDAVGLYHENGFVREGQLKEIADGMEHFSHAELLKLLIQLELCFETTSGCANELQDSADTPQSESSCEIREHVDLSKKFFVPAVFDDDAETAVIGRRQLNWNSTMHRKDFCYDYIGRRLACDTNDFTVFSTGFFPRLQVALHSYFREKGWLENRGFRMDRNLFGFYENGVEVLVEYSGAVDYFVDILVKSSRSSTYTVEFINVHVIQQIRQFCASPQGCPGVLLVESVIRTVCVKELHLCVHRKHQATPVDVLRSRIQEHGLGYKHAWRESLDRHSDVDKAVDLLQGGRGGDGSNTPVTVRGEHHENDYLLRQISTVTNFESASMDHDHAAEWGSENVYSMNPIPSVDVRGGFQSEFENAASIVDRPSTSTFGRERLPSLLYASIDDVGYLPAIWAKVEAKMAVKIHLKCESPHGSHVVPDQQGRMLNLRRGGNFMEQVLIFLRHGLTGSAQIAGMDVDAGWFNSLFGSSSNMPIKIEHLLELTDRPNPSAPASNEEILHSLETYLKVEPPTQWLRDFLNMDNGPAFRKDFDLWKMEVSATDDIAWVCIQHYIEYIRGCNKLLSQTRQKSAIR